MTKNTLVCDLKDCGKEWEKPEKYQQRTMQVVYTTDQTEGRCVEPYFENLKLDICPDCMGKIMKSRRYLEAHGAQGYHNVYMLKDDRRK